MHRASKLYRKRRREFEDMECYQQEEPARIEHPKKKKKYDVANTIQCIPCLFGPGIGRRKIY